MSNLVIKENEMTQDKIDLVKRTICKGATNDELQMFVGVCNKTGLDPFTKQIYAVKRWDSKEGREVMAVQVSIDGFRLVAARTGEYEGQTPVFWCNEKGEWADFWLSPKPPVAAKVGVWRKNFKEPTWGFARFDAYKQTNKQGQLTTFWNKFPELMIGKVAEGLALRKAFPMELSGLYTPDEMDQASEPSDQAQAKTEQKTEAIKEMLVKKEEPKPVVVEAEVVKEEVNLEPIPAPIPEREDPAAFMESKPEMPPPAPKAIVKPKKADDPLEKYRAKGIDLLSRMEASSNQDELNAIIQEINKEIKPDGLFPLSKLPAGEARAFKEQVASVRDSKKHEFDLEKKILQSDRMKEKRFDASL